MSVDRRITGGLDDSARDEVVYISGEGSTPVDDIVAAIHRMGASSIVVGRHGMGLFDLDGDAATSVTILPDQRSIVDHVLTEVATGSLAAPSGVIALTDDVVAEGALLADALGLSGPSPGSVLATLNKAMSRRITSAAAGRGAQQGIILRDSDVERVGELVGYPAVLKPVYGAAGILVSVVRDEDELRAAFQLASKERDAPGYWDDSHMARSRAMLLEPLLPGGMPSYHPMIADYCSAEVIVDAAGEITCFGITDREWPLWGTVETGWLFPSPRPSEQRAAIEAAASEAVAALGLRSTFAHVELRLSADGEALPIEVNARIGGANAELHRLASGSTWALDSVVALALGRQPTAPPPCDRYAMEVYIYPSDPRVCSLVAVEGLDEVRELPGVSHALQIAPNGTRLDPSCGLEMACATIFLATSTPESCLSLAQQVRDLVNVVTDG